MRSSGLRLLTWFSAYALNDVSSIGGCFWIWNTTLCDLGRLGPFSVVCRYLSATTRPTGLPICCCRDVWASSTWSPCDCCYGHNWSLCVTVTCWINSSKFGYLNFQLSNQTFLILVLKFLVSESPAEHWELSNSGPNGWEMGNQLSSLTEISVALGFYPKDRTFQTDAGMISPHPNKRRSLRCKNTTKMFDSYGRPPPEKWRSIL